MGLFRVSRPEGAFSIENPFRPVTRVGGSTYQWWPIDAQIVLRYLAIVVESEFTVRMMSVERR